MAGSCAHQAAAGEDLTDHERSFLARIAEHVTRVAAVLAYYRRARDGGDAVCLDDARDALSFVQSCYDELRRQSVWAAATADAEAATWATKRLGALSDRYSGSREGSWRRSTTGWPARPQAPPRACAVIRTPTPASSGSSSPTGGLPPSPGGSGPSAPPPACLRLCSRCSRHSVCGNRYWSILPVVCFIRKTPATLHLLHEGRSIPQFQAARLQELPGYCARVSGDTGTLHTLPITNMGAGSSCVET